MILVCTVMCMWAICVRVYVSRLWKDCGVLPFYPPSDRCLEYLLHAKHVNCDVFFWRARERSSKFKCCCFGVFLNAVYAICMQKAARACHWSTVLCAKRHWGFPLEFKKRSSIDHRVTQAIFVHDKDK
jgi:hypothetical protein